MGYLATLQAWCVRPGTPPEVRTALRELTEYIKSLEVVSETHEAVVKHMEHEIALFQLANETQAQVISDLEAAISDDDLPTLHELDDAGYDLDDF